MIDDFINRKHGKKKSLRSARVEGNSRRNYGVILYQEQVMQIAIGWRDFRWAKRTSAARPMGKKNREKWRRSAKKFLAGCAMRKFPGRRPKGFFD